MRRVRQVCHDLPGRGYEDSDERGLAGDESHEETEG